MKASLAAYGGAALLLAGMLTTSLAATPNMQGDAAEHHAMRNGGAAERGATEQTLVERRIADLHRRLRITPAQEPQWRAFARVMRENARDMDRLYRQRAEQLSRLDAQQDLESYARLEQARARDVDRLVQPFAQLYAALSPQQKHEADALFRAYARQHQHRAQASSH